MTARRILDPRRFSETFDIDFGGLSAPHTVTVGYYADGSVGEVFITGGKSGEQVEAIARDSAVLLSLALQHGVALDTIAHALTRNSRGEPNTIICTVVDRLMQEKGSGACS
ncbi:hypothetical protein HL667_33685 [Bradyrhizobium sp. 83012]|uniref:ribonucleoside-diphosphate reductase n=1 Tax=Bradyrhizobium aeschynomenes TaxID=2734909 RepID=A0ABX2CRC9_9BRAD|nr:hypothetical protein [Bradyrhizobium aeschynomenes]NPU69984.1 hypothetical protein [Bradyrhizobium aeschynomenes]